MSIKEIRKNHELAERVFHESDAHQDRAELLRVIGAVEAFVYELSNDEAANVQEGGVPSRMSLHIANRLRAILRGEESSE